ncbi:MAG: Ig-like domain-containing protein [Bacteroidota bacterium]
MERIYKLELFTKTRFRILCNLVFFVIIIPACNTQSKQEKIIITDGKISSAIFIPSDSIPGMNKTMLGQEIVVKLMGSQESMLGEYFIDTKGVLFKPLIGLTPGNIYQVSYKDRILVNLTVPLKKSDKTSGLTAIYPSADTLPENLLKVYLNFSQRMRRGVSENYLTMLDEKGDTLKNIFLNLNTELWDENGRLLTIWLDPGRIKRGLQPNEKDGNPLQTGNAYTLAVSSEWPDLRGNKLNKQYSKRFVATVKDIQSPDPSTWRIIAPESKSRQALLISFYESLDYSLLYNTISIIHRSGQTVKGKIIVNKQESSLSFLPESNWSAGTYSLKIDSRLEDLAGNNLNRLFDRDLLKDKPAGKERFYTRQFTIK